ncbi:hypothetical protein FE257_010092 [Aspergillus nanangensis]|uniref:HMG box domain-containing protein n=1 Tax=Aspergillus nanangensis TaxID=2582783 RepID=A0AAD4CJ52_ASPNN|nr:hypothetical protein FE257_010092 [Aspergillus nanangensis]
MPFALARRGGGLLRSLHLNESFSGPIRVVVSQPHVRCITFATRRCTLRPIPSNIAAPGVLSKQLINNTYATASDGQKTKSKKTPAKPKKTAEKAKPKRKVLTEKQKDAKKARELRQLIKDLKITALEPPKRLPDNYWNLAVVSKLSEAEKTSPKGAEAFKAATELAKAISEAERERFVDTAASNKRANTDAYERWIKSHTPLQIKDANLARRRLANLKNTSVPQLRDERLVKRPRSAYVLFYTERTDGGDFKHMVVKDIAARVAEEWRGLTDAEKTKYRQLQENDQQRYIREYRDVYGEDPALVKSESESSEADPTTQPNEATAEETSGAEKITPPWGDRGVTALDAGTKKPPKKDSSINVRINLDLRADVALELHAVVQGDVTIGLF